MNTATCRYSVSRSTRLPAFTLLELVVVIAIVTALLALMTTGLVRVRHGAKSIKCLAQLRAVAVDFQVFSDGKFGEDRGRSNRCPDGVFYFEDFVEKQYKIDEFWEQADRKAHAIQPSTSRMICPTAQQKLVRYPDRPCNDGALLPFENVSYAFNRRLYAETIVFDGRMVFNPKTKVSSRILAHPTVPLAFDGDGVEAQRKNRRPYFSAPPFAATRIYTPAAPGGSPPAGTWEKQTSYSSAVTPSRARTLPMNPTGTGSTSPCLSRLSSPMATQVHDSPSLGYGNWSRT